MLLDSAPPFEAISYVWGDVRRHHNLFFANGFYLPITASLSSGLPILSTHCKTKFLWIDQICINQENVSERNHQVKAMGDIYKKSTKVLLYVGLFGPGLDAVLTIAEDCESREDSLVQLQSALEDQMQYNYYHWLQLIQFLRYEWFSRAWCFQEVTLARDPRFVLGKRMVSFDALFRLTLATSRIETQKPSCFKVGEQECVTTLKGFHRLYAMAQVRSERAMLGECRNFWQILSDVAPHSLSSDPRDILYAFLGLLQDKRIEILADYDSSLSDALTNAAKSIIEGTQDLSILSFVPRRERHSSSGSGIPSWVPDWRKEESTLSLASPGRDCPYSASAGWLHRKSGVHGKQEKGLVVKGKIIARLSDLIGSSFGSTDEHWTSRKMHVFLSLE